MRANKRKKIEAAGWKLGTIDEFLELSPQQMALLEMKLALGHSLRERRLKRSFSQMELAGLIDSSQSRIAKMEAGDPSVSIDLLMKALLALGASPKDLAKTITMSVRHAA